jgi:hypothetical protein
MPHNRCSYWVANSYSAWPENDQSEPRQGTRPLSGAILERLFAKGVPARLPEPGAAVHQIMQRSSPGKNKSRTRTEKLKGQKNGPILVSPISFSVINLSVS